MKTKTNLMMHHNFIANYSIGELLCAVVARELSNDDIVAIGLHAELMLTAAFVAQKLYAPGLRIRHGLRFDERAELNPAAWTEHPDSKFHSIAEYRETHDSILSVAQKGPINKICNTFFVSGMQIDKEGATNLIGIKDSRGKLRSRGPGSIGISSVAHFAKKYFIFSLEHSTRRFVQKCDYVSSAGYNVRKDIGISNGPQLCITPLCVFDFAGESMRIKSIHAHASLQDVLAKTGFKPIIPKRIPITKVPSAEELACIRSIDRHRVLQKIDREMVFK